MKYLFTKERAEILMRFIAQNGWCNDAEALRILLWYEFPGVPELLRDYKSLDGNYVRGYYDSAEMPRTQLTPR